MDALESNDAGRRAPSVAERRRHLRVSVAWMATLKTARGVFECMVIDVSAGGAKLAFTETPAFGEGEAMTLEIEPRGAFRALSVWRRDDFAGIRFLDPPETIAAALRGVLRA